MTPQRLLQRVFAVTLMALVLYGYSTVHAQPASGDWKAPTSFGELGFTVNPDGTKITKIIFDVRNWSCGPISGSWTTTSYWIDPAAGWVISNGQFTIIRSGTTGSLSTIWTVNGTFDGTGQKASGTWGFDVSGTTCAGNWGPAGPVVFVEDVHGTPERFALHQNYPNPFNPTTTIKFDLPKSSEIRLSVSDILGREVSVLVNEWRDAGIHEVNFDGSNLASGVYFYRLQAGPSLQSKKLMIAK
jgi:Secretion system C-terminal sorting domain